MAKIVVYATPVTDGSTPPEQDWILARKRAVGPHDIHCYRDFWCKPGYQEQVIIPAEEFVLYRGRARAIPEVVLPDAFFPLLVKAPPPRLRAVARPRLLLLGQGYYDAESGTEPWVLKTAVDWGLYFEVLDAPAQLFKGTTVEGINGPLFANFTKVRGAYHSECGKMTITVANLGFPARTEFNQSSSAPEVSALTPVPDAPSLTTCAWCGLLQAKPCPPECAVHAPFWLARCALESKPAWPIDDYDRAALMRFVQGRDQPEPSEIACSRREADRERPLLLQETRGLALRQLQQRAAEEVPSPIWSAWSTPSSEGP